MTILDRLEKTLGRFAIPGLIRYVVALHALVFILLTLQPDYIQALQLDPIAFRNHCRPIRRQKTSVWFGLS